MVKILEEMHCRRRYEPMHEVVRFLINKRLREFLSTGCPKKTWEFSDEFDIVFVMN